MIRNMITIGLLLVSVQTWGQDEPAAKAIVTYQELMRPLQQADEATRRVTLGEIQRVIDAFQKEEWVIEFFPFEEGNPEPFLPLLDRALPFGSQVTWDPQLRTLAVYTSAAGIDQVGELGSVIGSLSRRKTEQQQREAEERHRQQAAESFPGVILEFLILEGEEITDASAPSISQEAREMDLTESDLSFLGRRAWRTYGKGFVHVNEGFDTRFSGVFVEGRVDWRSESRVQLEIQIRLQLEREGPAVVQSIFRTETEVELGETALLGTTGIEQPLLLAVRAKLGGSLPAARRTEARP
jgi:hypothetical protein